MHFCRGVALAMGCPCPGGDWAFPWPRVGIFRGRGWAYSMAAGGQIRVRLWAVSRGRRHCTRKWWAVEG